MKRELSNIYAELGERSGIARIADEFTAGLYTDPQLACFFSQMSSERKNTITSQVASFLTEQSGGAEKYDGKMLISALSGLSITEKQWATAMGHMIRALEGNNVPKASRDELIAYLSAMGEEIANNAELQKSANERR